MTDQPATPERWWKCPKCGGVFHDSQERHRKDVSWDMPPECGLCSVEMRVTAAPVSASVHGEASAMTDQPATPASTKARLRALIWRECHDLLDGDDYDLFVQMFDPSEPEGYCLAPSEWCGRDACRTICLRRSGAPAEQRKPDGWEYRSGGGRGKPVFYLATDLQDLAMVESLIEAGEQCRPFHYIGTALQQSGLAGGFLTTMPAHFDEDRLPETSPQQSTEPLTLGSLPKRQPTVLGIATPEADDGE